MKFATALIASAAAFDPVNWPGQSDEDPCGTQVSLFNQNCANFNWKPCYQILS